MDLIWSLGLILVVLLALNHMAGGRAASVIRPVTGIVTQLISMIVRALAGLVGTVLRLGAGSLTGSLTKVKGNTKDDKRGAGPPPQRWKE
jgi:hypothetical protein